ncbi:MAG: SDR family NAD(P)-dependent oxidoreductase [Rhodovibrionaceae bacterium]
MRDPSSILITGASSGIGEALARRYARAGRRLFLGGRDAARLEAVADACRAAGAKVSCQVQDVTDGGAMAAWVAACDSEAPLELAIANAGVSAGTGGLDGETEEQARRIYAVNLDGVMNTLFPALARMRARRRGQIAVMSSLAAFRGFPGAPAYCGSKAAVRVWGESLRPTLAREGIGVTVICPGFVESRMTAVNDFPMPLLMSSEKAAGIVEKGLARNQARIAFPLRLYAAVWLLNALPPGWTDRAMGGLPKKS